MIKYCEALNLYKDLGNTHGMGICYNNIGNIHLKNSRYQEAIESYEEAVKKIEEERGKLIDQRKESEKEILFSEPYRKYTKIWANRLFQLSEAKLEKIVHENKCQKKKRQNVELESLVFLYESAKSTYTNLGGGISFSKSIAISVRMSFVYSLLDNLEKAEEIIYEAENLYQTLEKRGFENLDCPESVLKQKIYVQKGILAKQRKKYRDAVEYFTLSLETCDLYDPRTKKELFFFYN